MHLKSRGVSMLTFGFRSAGAGSIDVECPSSMRRMSGLASVCVTSRVLFVSALLLLLGCSEKPARTADDASSEESPSGTESESSSSVSTKPAKTDEDAGAEEESAAKKEQKAEPAEPAFSETMSVDEAIKAVPAGFERRNIDQETLGKPLQDAGVYEPCKPGSARVKLRVAVWEGRAVGVDVTTTPKNEKLAECIKGRIRELKWDARVKSLNTIEYQL
ncbi:MAG TPA: hypothetical protein VFQ61_27995 [Polyangiaceae bacterium]|nr:hypothetical protein [Polyangiaceae bacterium]